MEKKEVLPLHFKASNRLDDLQSNPVEAIENIMNTYGTEIKKFIYTYLNNESDTDDVTQEVFVTVYLKLSSFQGRSSLKSWIYSIAVNKCKDYLRNNRLRQSKLIEKITNLTISSKIIDVPEEYKQSSIKEGLFEKVIELPIKYREVIILYYFKELSIKEISFILNMKETTLQTRLLRARSKLKSLLNEGGIFHG
ncbi:RNA polymerase subunit sigma [Bacillus sp. FJAT-22090]|uniref:sigma-70 family RNA polymerase sigma factor n=1 Tax=Bacillus sp. FJAT-22090 TaxID=1581038 RepID=UPI0006AF7CC2|nr:sigma-70 family RNA polymerase sigma factor [Bacillus sp. FJAT-22090]ALC85263.1 RNA polymerase subunit sigma [Bacillus sp. FJAT-22090]